MEKDNIKMSSCESTTKCVMILWEGPVPSAYAPASAVRGRERWDYKALRFCNNITSTYIKL